MQRFLIFAPNWLGDAVMALPAIADLRRAHPAATLTVAARPAVAPLFPLVREVDAVVEISGRASALLDRSANALSERTANASAERSANGLAEGSAKALAERVTAPYDVALLLPNSFNSALIAYRAGIAERWGYAADWRRPLLTRVVPRPRRVHQVAYYQRLVAALGFANGPPTPRIELTPEIVADGARVLRDARWDGQAPLVALAPGAAYGGAKRWPPEHFAELARAFAPDGIRTVLVGSGADAATGREVEHAGGPVLNLIGRTSLAQLAGVLKTCRAVVSNDSGAMHLAAAVGVPVTALFGPTDETATAPSGALSPEPSALSPQPLALSPQPLALTRVVVHPVWCRPCMLRECPLDHACMRGITADRVRAATQEAFG